MINQRISVLREQMKTHGLAAYIIPATDPHQSEYIAPHWQGRTWISGFNGSAGTVVVTHDFAGLWTDSRYFIQAERQLAGSEIQLMRLPKARKPNQVEWIAENLQAGDKVGIDRQLLSMASADRMTKAFEDGGISLVPMDDLLEKIWEDRPEIPLGEAMAFGLHYAGESRTEKLSRIRAEMKKQKLDYHLITALDDLAWTFNLRGTDVDYNPVVIAYALVGEEDCILCINPQKLSDKLKQSLEGDGIKLFGYEQIGASLSAIAPGKKIRLAPNLTSMALKEQLKEGVHISKGKSIPAQFKGCKNATEAGHIRKAMEKDGVALVRFLRWLEEAVPQGGITEVVAQDKLHEFRAQQKGFVGDSFHTIAGYAGNGAIVHYSATPEIAATLEPKGLFLLDSGGQYLDGTTDITRTIAMGPLTDEEKRDYTLVLQGHISLGMAQFREGTTGANLDILAREAMWAEGIDYGHGTGHGVGFFLNVHEGPQSIGQGNAGPASTPMKPGMVTSNEPGIYRAGKHGVRIENLVLTTEAEENEFGKFMHFETLTMCPIDTRPIVVEMLTARQRAWLNVYHEEVYKRLAPYLDEEEQAWLEERCVWI
jgi:Xaa-Pro aminopeptidase